MSFINGVDADIWIPENHPENGWFRVYWSGETDEYLERRTGVSLEDTGFGLRYEWEYKDGERVDGISKGWDQDGNLIHTANWKDGELEGWNTHWYENGNKESEVNYKDGKKDGLFTVWYKNGQKKEEGTYKCDYSNKPMTVDTTTTWTPDGKVSSELIYKDGKPWNGEYILWKNDGWKSREKIYKDGNLIFSKRWNMEGDEI